MTDCPQNDRLPRRGTRGAWREQMRRAIRDAAVLARHCGLTEQAATQCARVAATYPVCVTPYYLSLARRRSPDDPIIRQILPCTDELADDGMPDPFGEGAGPLPGVVHRYPDRVLLILTHQCAVHCRHCLRKRLWNASDGTLGNGRRLEQALDYLAQHPAVREVIVSGGDPLLLPDSLVFDVLERLHSVPNIEIVRLATRLPVVLPHRFDARFCRRLGGFGPTWLVTHFNHPRELTEQAEWACTNLVRAGIPVLNQTVLLRGVNDEAETIRALCTGLVRMRVKPYYLFHGDPVAGAMHFRTGIRKGLDIMRALHGHTSGLARPTFAIDLPGGEGKVPLTPADIESDSVPGPRAFRGYRGRTVLYDDGCRDDPGTPPRHGTGFTDRQGHEDGPGHSDS